jgi:hypothetical protein
MRKGMVVITKILPDMTMPKKMPDIVKKMKMPDKVKTIKMPDMVKKIKMLDMVAVKRIMMPEKMEHRQVAGCRTLMDVQPTPPVVHEEEVHTNDYANSRSKTTG